MTTDLQTLARMAGVMPSFWDQRGTERHTSDETAHALLTAMGYDVADDAATAKALAEMQAARANRAAPDYLIAEPGQVLHLNIPDGARWRLKVEQGDEFQGVARGGVELPVLELGIHKLWVNDDLCTLLAAPPRLPEPDRGWGVTLPLYGLRSAAQGGVGDYADLATAVSALGHAGAGFVGINPIHAGFPTDPANISPYMPSHRRRLNVSHIHVDGLAAQSHADHIDFGAEWAAKEAALAARWAASGTDPGFDSYLTAEGRALVLFATYEALAEVLGPNWDSWPEAYRDASGPEVRAFRTANAERVRYHAWLQYLAEGQVAEVARTADAEEMAHGLYLDLAVGTHPFGAETWAEPQTFAPGVSLGAPPDAFSPDGQTWILAPMNPRALIAQSFEPLAMTLRKQLQFARLLRIDHILGFERAFWVPLEADCPGAYVEMPRDAMLAVVRIEAARAGATIVGEDLGNVPEGLEGDLVASGILGCRLGMFETARYEGKAPEHYTELALASFGTHDLPTWAGWREMRDIGLRHELGSLTDETASHARDGRAYEVGQMDAAIGDASGHVDGMHRFMGAVASRLVAVQIEDVLGVADQPNLPGTIDEYPNWRRRLPLGAEALVGHPDVERVAKIMAEAGRSARG